MDPIWYTIRTIVSVVMAGIGGLLLWAAYLVCGNVTGAAIAWMVLLAAAIPAGFFAMFTIVGWQRSTAAQAKPSPLVAWCGDPRRYAVLWLAFVGLLFGGAHQIVQEIKQGDAERADLQAYHRAVRDTLFDACWNRAGQSFREEAGTGDVTLRPRMMSYCTCLDIEVEKSYTPEQFAAVPKERWWARGDDNAAENPGLHGLHQGGARRRLHAGDRHGNLDRPCLAGRQRQIPPDRRPLHKIRRALARLRRAHSSASGTAGLGRHCKARRCRMAMRQRRYSLGDLTRQRASV